MLVHRFSEAAKHLVAEGNDLDPGGDGGWEGSAVVVTLILTKQGAVCVLRMYQIDC